MKQRFLLLITLMFAFVLNAGATDGDTYSVTFKRESAEMAIRTLKKTTGYDFVYHKDLIKENTNTVTGVYKKVTLENLLNVTIVQQLNLKYKIVGKTVSLSAAPTNMHFVYDHTITGRVVDEEGEPLPGATVMLKGTTLGTSTDIEGHFSLYVHHTDPELDVSYVGMYPKTIKLNALNIEKPLLVTLQTNASIMDEVVVTGYQNIKRENATGAYSILTGDELNKRHNADIVSSLEGNVAGLVKNRAKSYAEGENQLVIRGVGTFQASSAPLVVVDGLPIEGGIESVNNYDIASVTVLKDAAAAAIYGARASNGVIVITTKKGDREKLSVDFNADISFKGKTDYSKAGWADAAQLIDLERRSFNGMKENDEALFNGLLAQYNGGRLIGISPLTRLFIDNFNGLVSDEQMNATLAGWAANDYRKQWQNVVERTRVSQLYNIQLRNKGKILSSSVTFNYSGDNLGMKKEDSQSYQFRYRGDLKAAKWLDLSFAVNVLHNSSKRNPYDYKWGGINGFRPYESLYNADGSRSSLEADAPLSDPAFAEADYGLKDHSYNMLNEVGLNSNKSRTTNIRAYIDALFHLPVKGWDASLMYQHEDISGYTATEYSPQSYFCRDIFNRYTTGGKVSKWVDTDIDLWEAMFDPDFDWERYNYYDPMTGDFFMDDEGNMIIKEKQWESLPTIHHVPDGGYLSTYNSHSVFYTFRAQTNFTRTFLDRHDVSVLAGFEYRQNRISTNSSVYLGYDHQTLQNHNIDADWNFINGFGSVGVLGNDVPAVGLNSNYMYVIGETLHRYYSYYFTANYVYDSRYSIFGSYRVDKTDLFGTDPKFRGRPLWSVGGSWNIHNERFMQPISWLDALKLRVSYGLTGNIDSNAKSFLVATMGTNRFNNGTYGSLQTPPNQQLRWEKTSTWNWGLDFSLFNFRLSGSIDAYRKYGSDLLTNVALDITTGYESQLLNAGEMMNTGVELQLNGRILPALSRRDVGVSLGATFGYNHNKVTKVYYHPRTGAEFRTMALKQGYPLRTCVGIDYAGLMENDGVVYGTWRDHNGEIHNTSINQADFTIDDCHYLGTYTPVWTGSLTPEVRWQGFTLSGMLNFYGGHMMNVDSRVWDKFYSSVNGYSANTPANAIDYWNGVEGALPNGYAVNYLDYSTSTIGQYDYRNFERADYLKFRSLTLAYDFDPKLIRRIGVNELRLRFQVDNLCTWARNSRGWDPEATRLSNGLPIKNPRTFTMSLFFNL